MKNTDYAKLEPFNISLFQFTKEKVKYMQEVSVLNIFEHNTRNFHEEGLFSTSIFGKVGTDERMKKVAYINLNIKVLNPLVYLILTSLNKNFSKIISGEEKAIWSKKEKTFIPTFQDDEEGSTGFNFFMSHFEELEFGESTSDLRKEKVALISGKTVDEVTIDKFLVLPAGLRDYTMDDNGKPTEDEVNGIYRKLMIISNNIKIKKDVGFNPYIDNIRDKTQKVAVATYMHFFNLIDGKKKQIQGKTLKRATAYGTRNVITPAPYMPKSLIDENVVNSDEMTVGLFQLTKAFLPIASYRLNSLVLNKLFDNDSNKALLVNKKTLKQEYVFLDNDVFDFWVSSDGVNSLTNKLGKEEVAKSEISVTDKYYLCMLYDDGKRVKIITDLENMDKELDPKFLRPITFIELFYLVIVNGYKRYPALTSRYPTGKEGTVTPVKIKLRTTNKETTRIMINDYGDDITLLDYPILKEGLFTSLSPHPSRLMAYDGDFDGDMMGFSVFFLEDSVEEIEKLLDEPSHYIASTNKLMFTAGDDILNNVIKTGLKTLIIMKEKK